MASPAQIAAALDRDAFQVLHLSAHGSATSVELEDEDGDPVPTSAQELIGALRHAQRPVPLIVLSACSGAAAIAARLIELGADRVIAMQARVTDVYATALARALYRELAAHPTLPAAQALARARIATERWLAREFKGRPQERMPEYAVATVLSAAADAPLVDPALAPVTLSRSARRPWSGSGGSAKPRSPGG